MFVSRKMNKLKVHLTYNITSINIIFLSLYKFEYINVYVRLYVTMPRRVNRGKKQLKHQNETNECGEQQTTEKHNPRWKLIPARILIERKE
jgi:hypothetical protein